MQASLFGVTGALLFFLALYAFMICGHLLRKILAVFVMGSGAFLVLVAIASRAPGPHPDPVPQAMVLTGIVVAVAMIALALVLMRRIFELTGATTLPEDDHDARH